MSCQNNIGQLSEYDQRMIHQFQDKIIDGELAIKDDQELTDLSFIQNLNVSKVKLNNCQNIKQNVVSDNIKELCINSCNFVNVDGLKLNNLEVLSLRESRMESAQKILVQMQNNPIYSQLKELNLSKSLHIQQEIQNHFDDQNYEEELQLNDQKSMVNLVKLTLHGNIITNISVLSTFANLEELDLSMNRNINIDPIQYLKKLTKLSLENCGLTNIQDLSSLTNLIELNLAENEGIDISPIHELTQLVKLNLYWCKLQNIIPLKNLSKLACLEVSCNEIEDMSQLSSLNNLKDLSASFMKFVDITPFNFLENLTFLNISHTQILSMSVLRKLTNLEELYISAVTNFDISPLQYLVKLTFLDISGNYVYDVTALKPLVNLQYLNLLDTNLSDVSPLFELKKLSKLFLGTIYSSSTIQIQQDSHLYNILHKLYYISPTMEQQFVYDQIKRINSTVTLLQNVNHSRKCTRARFGQLKQLTSQYLQTLSLNHIQFSKSIASLFNKLDIVESCQ
ncbi:leucine_Rich Repeat (LRR)-containing protein [Hexamita inflata]|uniref:Leucine Rich Repeat (LRR)-containing protein n=1 Tax=Hexamita inflata TaxID=28002 RepID=A0AA86P0X4_9EUKA|nr:leucine Rich Repeat (LRR)-containing protein [Hexamita inflata]